MRSAVVVGSGAGGAAAALALASDFRVTVLEAGREFRPFATSLALPERLKRAGLLRDARAIRLLFPAMRIGRAGGLILVRGIGTGGTTTLATGNALRADWGLRAIGLDLSPEFEELERDVPISTAHAARWRPSTRALAEAFRAEGWDVAPMPKMGDGAKCINCGRCVLGCPRGAKWDSRAFIRAAAGRGASLVLGRRAVSLRLESGRARAVRWRSGLRRGETAADLVVLAAGGLETPRILERSGISCPPRLFVDPVLCVAAAWPEARQDREIPMPFAAQADGFILSPYFDHLSYFFDRRWRPRAGDTVSLMIKLADSPEGRVRGRRVEKRLTGRDRARLASGEAACRAILRRLGIDPATAFLGTLNAGHPGGQVPLGPGDAESLHPSILPANVYVADASLLPDSLGNPPILTVMALARRVARRILARSA